ncbi:MAG TPA: hypothetical protein PL182_07055 [Pseudobdellovibrionaceae bacterium]|nr:hypothetical protein [Pseudobdellovibrionaceae bacterium]
MKKVLMSLAILMSVSAPTFAKAPREAKRAAQKFCKEQGFSGAEFRTCVKEQMKLKKKK